MKNGRGEEEGRKRRAKGTGRKSLGVRAGRERSGRGRLRREGETRRGLARGARQRKGGRGRGTVWEGEEEGPRRIGQGERDRRQKG